jgi:hypothetical protein
MKQKRIIGLLISFILVLLLVGVSPVMAAKPERNGTGKNVISLSNGFPSGPHFNLNIHGRELDWTGTPEPGGNSVYVGITGESTIEYVSNKMAKNTADASQFELYAIDPLAECFAGGDPARVYLPYNILVNDESVSAQGYYVFGRILGKPNNGSEDAPSSIMIYPTFVVQSVNCTGTEEAFGDLLEDPENAELALGLITSKGNLFGASLEGYERFPAPEPIKGKGKSKATEITQLFKWSGYVTDNTSLDTNVNDPVNPGVPDGHLDEYDVPLVPWDGSGPDTLPDGVIDEAELINWLDWLVSIGEAVYYPDEWIFNIADLVIAGQTVVNDGTKLFQIRFYPVATTEFSSDYMPDPPQ